jgi:hypothetical protein
LQPRARRISHCDIQTIKVSANSRLFERDEWEANRAFAAGLLGGGENARLDVAMAAATKAFAELADAKPFWRAVSDKLWLAKRRAAGLGPSGSRPSAIVSGGEGMRPPAMN